MAAVYSICDKIFPHDTSKYKQKHRNKYLIEYHVYILFMFEVFSRLELIATTQLEDRWHNLNKLGSFPKSFCSFLLLCYYQHHNLNL